MEAIKFKKGDKFILELGDRKLDEFEIAGTDLYVRISLLKQLTPYKPDEEKKEAAKWFVQNVCVLIPLLLTQEQRKQTRS